MCGISNLYTVGENTLYRDKTLCHGTFPINLEHL
jgi:hypothetical protein